LRSGGIDCCAAVTDRILPRAMHMAIVSALTLFDAVPAARLVSGSDVEAEA